MPHTMPPKAEAFWTKAREYVKKSGEWVQVKKDSPELEAWKAYFRGLAWKPFMISQIETKLIESIMTPTQWPEWFDKDYAERRVIVPFIQR
jgi:hypothetical protein